MKQKTVVITILIIIILIVAVFLFLVPTGVSLFFESLKNTDILLFTLACIIMLISNAVGALRWAVLVNEVHATKSALFSHAFGVYSLGQITGLIVPSRVGNYAKVPLISRIDNISYEAGISAVNAETIIDLAYISIAGIVSLGIFSILLYSSFQFISILLVFFLIALIIVIAIILYYISFFKELFEKSILTENKQNFPVWKRVPAQCIIKLFDLIQSTRDVLANKRCVLQAGIFTLVFQFMGVLTFLLVMKSVSVTLPVPVVFAIFTISILTGIISLIPGGLGVSDLSQIILLASQGISLPVATNIVLLWRIVMYLPIILVIGIYLLDLKITKRDR